MNHEINTEDIGEQLGMEGVGSVVSKVEAYCAYEERRIALTNQPRIVSLRAEASLLLEEERELSDRLKLAPPPSSLGKRRTRALYCVCIAIFLTLAGFVFSLYSLEPFRLGFKGYLYCLGIAMVTPFLVHQTMERLKSPAFLKTLVAVACLAALASLVLLAVVRGNLLAESLRASNPVVVDDAQPQEAQSGERFYDKTIPLLQLVMILLALSMELGAGLALHEAWQSGRESTEDWDTLRQRVTEIRGRFVTIAFEITALENEPHAFAARFWGNFYRAMITHTVRSAMTKFFIALAAILLVAHGHALAENHTTIVIAVDLSQSVAVRGPDGTSEFQKNMEAVTRQLAQVPADSQVTILGITDHSFTVPNILLSAVTPADSGYFGERLRSARAQILQAWRTRSAKLKPCYRRTDIIGILLLAQQVFENQRESGEKILEIYSDMRNSTPELNLELSTAALIPSKAPLARLKDVEVFVLGVDGAGGTIDYWERLRKFWIEYFEMAGAVVKTYSPLRALALPTQRVTGSAVRSRLK